MLGPHTSPALVATVDVGEAAAAAITDPDRFHEVELELAGDHLSMAEIAGLERQCPVLTVREDPERGGAARSFTPPAPIPSGSRFGARFYDGAAVGRSGHSCRWKS